MNAVVHRDYTCDGMISVDYFSGNLKISSPGRFYGGVTSENITTHQPRHRNKVLAKLLMQYQLVDRAGMGIKRMSIHSLAYGRAFPRFEESNGCIEVEMQGETIRPGIFVLTQTNPDKFFISDLLIFNSLYGQGYINIKEMEMRLSGIDSDPWKSIKNCISRNEQIELCGSNEGIFIRVNPKWNVFFDIKKSYKLAKTSSNHLKVFDFLKTYKEATNEEITSLLGYKHSATTSNFLKNSTYVKRTGAGPSSRWQLLV